MGGNLAFLTVSSGYFHGPVLFAQAWTLGNAGGTHTAKCSGDSTRCCASGMSDHSGKGCQPWVSSPPHFPGKKERPHLCLQTMGNLENLKTFLHPSSFLVKDEDSQYKIQRGGCLAPMCAGGLCSSQSPSEFCILFPSGGTPTGGCHTVFSHFLSFFSYFCTFFPSQRYL